MIAKVRMFGIINSLAIYMEVVRQRPLVIAGPSGVGKSFLAQQLLARSEIFEMLLSTTTRPRRSAEVDGVDMRFVSTERYAEIQAAANFFMDNTFFGQHYGYERPLIEGVLNHGNIPVALVYAPVVDQFVQAYPESTTLFLNPGDIGLLRKRMEQRGDAPASIAGRMAGIEKEMAAFEKDRVLYQEVVDVRDNTATEEAIARIALRYNLSNLLKT